MSIKSMTVKELKKKLDDNEEIILVDVREQHELDAGHIEAAVFIPLSEFENRFEELSKERPLVLQCRSGKRSMTAAEFLQGKGYADLSNLEGGILAWQEEGFDVAD